MKNRKKMMWNEKIEMKTGEIVYLKNDSPRGYAWIDGNSI